MGGDITEVKKRLDTVSSLLAHASSASLTDGITLLETAGELLHRINQDVLELTPMTLNSRFATSPLWVQIVRLTALQKRKEILTQLMADTSCAQQQQLYGQ